MTCSGCGTELPAAAAFCYACGATQQAPRCMSCGSELVAGAGFCMTCGTPAPGGQSVPAAGGASALVQVRPPDSAAPSSSERRLTSVLFADLVSYTTLSETRDTEDVRDLLTSYFDVCKTVVRRYGGTVEKFIGDAVMAVWGVPTAHEDDAERAVRAALELVASVAQLGESLGLPDLALRAGVVTGEVSTTIGATDQGMVAGDPVNTAARVQSTAAPGEVWVDANTRALTAAAVTYLDVGEHTLKGKAEAVRLFKAGTVVASLGGLQRVDGLEAPLAGRDRELRLIKELFHATEESGRPRLVVLDGDAGLGKSRLSWEFEKYIDGLSGQVRWHRGRCLSYGEGVAFWALAEAMRARLGLLDEDEGAASADALDRALHEYVDDPEERAWLRPRLASLLGDERSDFAREDLFSAWTTFFERVSEGTIPVVLVIDDAQYADEGLLDFLEHLLSTARFPIFVLLLARPELINTRPDLGGRRANVMRLEPLTDSAMATLVDGLVDGLPEATRAVLVERAEGVPLYAVETVRALIDRDLVTPSEGRYVVAAGTRLDLSTIGAPASLHALVAARLDTLTPDERRVMTDASVLGLSFTRSGIEMLSTQIEDLDRALDSLQRKEIIATETDRFSAERGHFRFVQSVVRQVAYSTLSRRDRKSRHLAVADHLSAQDDRTDELAVVIAQHLIDAVEAAGPDDPDVVALENRIADLLGRAGDRACSLGSYADGLRLFESAISHLGESEARAGLQEQAAEAAMALGRYDLVLELAGAALQLREAQADPLAAAVPAALQGEAHYRLGELGAAVELLRPRYEALLRIPGSERARLSIAVALTISLPAEDDETRQQMQLECLRLAEQLEAHRELTTVMNGFAISQLSRGSALMGKAILREAVEQSRTHGLWASLVRSEMNLGVFTLPWSCPKAAAQLIAAYEQSRQRGLHGWTETCAVALSVALWTVGDWIRLEQLLRDYLDASDLHDPTSASPLESVDHWRRQAGLTAILPETLEAPSDAPYVMAWQAHLRSLRAFDSGDLASASTDATTAVDLTSAAAGLQDDFMHLWPWAVRVALAAKDLTKVETLVNRVRDAYPGEVSTSLRAHALVLTANLSAAQQGDPAAIEADFRAGITAFDEYGSPPLRAQAQEDLGAWLIGQGRHADAQPLLDAAATTYSELGATAWMERLDQLQSAAARAF